MSDMDEGERAGEENLHVVSTDETLKNRLDEIAAKKRKEEALAKKEAADSEAFFQQHANKIAAAFLERANDERKAEEYISRKAEAERVIKSLITERLDKARSVSSAKTKEVALQHFVMIGGAQHADDLQSSVGHKIGIAHLKHGGELIAVRIEQQPGVVMFLVGKPDRFKKPETEMLKILISSVKQYMKPYLEVEQDVLKKILES